MAEDRNIVDLLAAVAEEADQNRDEETRMYRSKRMPSDASQVYSIRIPVSRIGQIRALASKFGLRPTAMLRKWILERLDQEEGNAHGQVDEAFAESASEISNRQTRTLLLAYSQPEMDALRQALELKLHMRADDCYKLAVGA